MAVLSHVLFLSLLKRIHGAIGLLSVRSCEDLFDFIYSLLDEKMFEFNLAIFIHCLN